MSQEEDLNKEQHVGDSLPDFWCMKLRETCKSRFCYQWKLELYLEPRKVWYPHIPGYKLAN